MPKYVVEFYFPEADADGLQSAASRARSAAAVPTGDGSGVRYLRSLLLPSDEICFLVYEAPSAAAVAEAARRAAITYERIVEAVDDGEAGG